jgi:hypothetical protein
MTAAQTPVLDTLADLTAISLERCALPPRELMLARIAALIAVDAPPASYMANAGAAVDSGITGEDVQAIMIGVAPVVGTTKVVASAGNIFRALGFAIMVAEAEMAEAVDPGADTPGAVPHDLAATPIENHTVGLWQTADCIERLLRQPGRRCGPVRKIVCER